MSKAASLLIPMKLRVSLVGRTTEKKIHSDLSYDFTCLKKPYDTLEKPVFTEKNGRKPGVYIHWSLPDCFTQGFQNENDDEVTYRLAPNRWAVIRMWDFCHPVQDDKLHGRAFMVESDIVSRTPTGGPSWPWTEDQKQPYRFVGRSYPMESEPEEGGGHIRLTAVSPATPFFAAYAPFCENVFSFYDDLTADGLTDVNLCYLVCGWYHEDGEEEPFKSIRDWEELRTKFGLSGEHAKFPSRTLCHGMIDRIHWEDEHAIYHTGMPDDPEPGQVVTMPDIAMGNNVSEALSVLLSGGANGEEEYLMNLMLQGGDKDIDRRQGIVKAEENSQQAKFGVHHVGGITGIHRRSSQNGEKAKEQLPEEYISRLAVLRCRQRGASKEHALLLQKQRDIYENWYLSLYADAPYDAMYLRQTVQAVEDAAVRLNRLTDEMEQIQEEQEALALELDKLGMAQEYELTTERNEPFYLPSEPTLVISQDMEYDEIPPETSAEHPLVCRVSGESVTMLNIVNIAGISTTLSGDSMLPEFELASRIPEDIREDILALAKESVLLSCSFTDFLGRCVFQKAGKTPAGDQFEVLVSQIRREQDCDERSSALFTGILPIPLARNRYRPQWYPLILEWQCQYYPDMKVMNGKPDLSRWSLQDGDYLYTCVQTSDPVINSDNEYTISGRLYISRHAQEQTEGLTDGLLGENNAFKEPLEEAVRKKVRLSQSLDGFRASLLMRKSVLSTALYHADSSGQGFADVFRSLDGSALGGQPILDELFAPMRAGFFSLLQLRMIDALGRFQDIVQPDFYAPESMRAPGAVNPVRYLMLPPRLLEPSGLTTYFITAGRAEIEESLGLGECSPICGFVISNLLDYSLAVYRGDGTLAGSLNVVQAGSGISWKSPPGTTVSHTIPDDLDAELYAFLQELMAAGSETLQELIEYINNLQYHMQSASHTPTRIELIGKPIAIARICVQLELMKRPETYRHYMGESERDKTSGTNVCAAEFPLLVGNLSHPADGTVGFFEDGDYRHFHGYGDCLPQKCSSYFVKGQPVKLRPDFQPVPRILTLLFDPWADITLTTGILPVRTMALVRSLVEEALQNMESTYFCSPVLTGGQINIPVSHTDSLAFYWESMDGDGKWNSVLLPYQDENIPEPDEQLHISEGYIRIREKDKETENNDGKQKFG